MSYINMILSFFLPMYMSDSLMAYIAYSLAGRRLPYRKVFALLTLTAIIQSFAWAAFVPLIYPDSLDIKIDSFMAFLFKIFEIATNVSWVWFLFRDMDIKKRFFYVSTVLPFHLIATHGANALMSVISPGDMGVSINDVAASMGRVVLRLASILLVYGCIVVLIWLVSKTSFWGKLQSFVNYPNLYIPMGVIYFLFYAILGAYGIVSMTTIRWLVAIRTLPYLALLVLVVLVVADIGKRIESLGLMTERVNQADSLLKLQSGRFESLREDIDETRRKDHDMRHHISLLRELLHVSPEKAADYIEELNSSLPSTEDPLCGNLAADCVIRQYVQAARSEGIIVEAAVNIPPLPGISDLDLCVVLSNLLENAMEALRKEPKTEKRIIRISAGTTGNMLTINVDNSLREPLRYRAGVLLSHKRDAPGVGLTSVNGVAEKHDGKFWWRTEDDMFRAFVVLKMEEQVIQYENSYM